LMSANYLLTDLSPLIANLGCEAVLSPKHFYELMTVLQAKQITSRVAKDLIIENATNDVDLLILVNKRNLYVNSDDKKLVALVKDIIESNSKAVAEYKSGKVTVLQFLLGQAMKITKGASDPNTLRKIFETELL